MTAAGGPSGMRAVMMRLSVTMEDGSTHSLDTSSTDAWEGRVGPVLWDHFFHGETMDGSLDPEWTTAAGEEKSSAAYPAGHAQAWSPAVVISPQATAPTGMQVMGADGVAIALGTVKPMVSPPLRVTGTFPAVAVTETAAHDVGKALVFDFAQVRVHVWCACVLDVQRKRQR